MLKKFVKRGKKAAKAEFKNEIKARVNKFIDDYVEKHHPELQPYMKDIRGALMATKRKGFKGLKTFMIKKVKKLAKAKVKEIKARVNKFIDDYVAKNHPELEPYMEDIRGALMAAHGKGFKGLKTFMIKKVKAIAKSKVNQAIDNYVAENFPELEPHMESIKSVLKVATKNPKNLKKAVIKQVKRKCRALIKKQLNT